MLCAVELPSRLEGKSTKALVDLHFDNILLYAGVYSELQEGVGVQPMKVLKADRNLSVQLSANKFSDVR